MVYDACVVGAGPSGCLAAYTLAHAGRSVLLLEKAPLPRYKTCGGGLVWRARQLIPFDIGPHVERECRTVEINFPSSDLHFTATKEYPLVSMTMRDSLDNALADAAQAEGAELLNPCEVTGIDRGPDSVTLSTSMGSYTASYVIAADGALSPVARMAGFADGRQLIPALESEIEVDEACFERYSQSARFDLGYSDSGYAWVFPKRDHLSVGVLSVSRTRPSLHKKLDAYMEALEITRSGTEERHGFVGPVAPRKGPYAHERVFLTGDSAGFAEPLTGEGISFAMKSGLMAAEAIVEAGVANAHDAERRYQRALAKGVLPELRYGRILAKFLYGTPRLRDWVFRAHGPRLVEAMIDVFAGERNYQDLVANPANYLKLLRPSTPRAQP